MSALQGYSHAKSDLLLEKIRSDPPCHHRKRRSVPHGVRPAHVSQSGRVHPVSATQRQGCGHHPEALHGISRRSAHPRGHPQAQRRTIAGSRALQTEVVISARPLSKNPIRFAEFRKIARDGGGRRHRAPHTGEGRGGVDGAHVLIFTMRRPDVLPTGDYGIQVAMKKHYRKRKLPKPKDMEKIARAWSPYRSVACWYLWRSLDIKTI